VSSLLKAAFVFKLHGPIVKLRHCDVKWSLKTNAAKIVLKLALNQNG